MRLKNLIEVISLKERSKKLPDVPGVYIMKNKQGEIIYIGKAKNLKNRVSSYFISDSDHSEKVKKMVQNVYKFDYIVTDSEFEALVLECSLIKKHQPKYNILLKDDKGYSYIRITNENWPKVLYEKKKNSDKDVYIGQYVNSFSVKKTVREVNRIFKLPTCSRNLEKIYKKPCLNFYINRCSAPCIRAIKNDDYRKVIDDVIKFIKKGSKETIKYFTKKMNEASENLNFEKAAEFRDKIKAIVSISSDQKVVSCRVKNQDVIALVTDEQQASVEVFRFDNGDLCENQNFIIDLQENLIFTRTEFLKSYYEMKENIPENIVLDGKINDQNLLNKFLSTKRGKKVNIIFPEKGEQFKILEMCKNNAYENLIKSKGYKTRSEDTIEDLKNILSLGSLPRYIEAYDISNLGGSDNVGVMVVFKDGKPLKSSYRKFKIKEILGQDDYGSMREVIRRRIKNYKENQNDKSFSVLPDLILVDGGKMHTAAVKNVLKDENVEVPVFGMVKNSKHKTRAITSDGAEIDIKSNTRVFNFIFKIQEEVHRYAINYHKSLRNKKIKDSVLINIKGVGEKRAKFLIKYFGSIKTISECTVDKLIAVPGIAPSVAKNIYDYFHPVFS